MNKQWSKGCIAVCAAGALSMVVAMGAGTTANVIGTGGVVSFPAQPDTSIPFPQLGAVLASGIPPAVFVGDYLAAGIRGAGFSVATSGTTPSACEVYFRGATGRMWGYPKFTLSANPSESVAVTAPFDFAAGWEMYAVGEPTADLFDADLQNVTEIGVRFLGKGIDQQTYTVSNFVLLGGGSYTLANQVYAYMLRWGIADMSALAPNGVSYYANFLAGSDTIDAATTFVLRVERVETATGVALQWNNLPGRKFAIWSTTDLGQPFTQVGETIPNDDANPGAYNVMPVEESDGQQHFYRIQILSE
jgi:hypothetical protein